jgi:adenylate cyclase
MKMKEWSENYQTQKIHLLDTGYASAVSLSGNRYLVFIPQDLTDTMFKSYDKNKTLVGELFDDEFLVINDRDEQDHNCYFKWCINLATEIAIML